MKSGPKLSSCRPSFRNSQLHLSKASSMSKKMNIASLSSSSMMSCSIWSRIVLSAMNASVVRSRFGRTTPTRLLALAFLPPSAVRCIDAPAPGLPSVPTVCPCMSSPRAATGFRWELCRSTLMCGGYGKLQSTQEYVHVVQLSMSQTCSSPR